MAEPAKPAGRGLGAVSKHIPALCGDFRFWNHRLVSKSFTPGRQSPCTGVPPTAGLINVSWHLWLPRGHKARRISTLALIRIHFQ